MKSFRAALLAILFFLLLTGCKDQQEPIQPTPTLPVQEATSTPTPSVPFQTDTPLPRGHISYGRGLLPPPL